MQVIELDILETASVKAEYFERKILFELLVNSRK